MELDEHAVQDGPEARPETRNEAERTGENRPRFGLPPWLTSWWLVVAALAVGLFFGLGFLRLMQILARPLALIVLAIAIASALAPLVRRLSSFLPYTVAVVLIYLVLLLAFSGVMWWSAPSLITQVETLILNLPDIFEDAIRWTNRGAVSDIPSPLRESFLNFTGSFAERILAFPVALANGVLDTLVTVVLSLYLLLAAPTFRKFLRSLLPWQRRDDLDELLRDSVAAMGGYLRGALISAAIVGTVTYIGLQLIGINYALSLAILSGLLEIVPILGPVISGVIITAVALTQSPTTAIIALIFVIVLQQIESNVIFPNVMSSQTELSPVVSFAAFFVGGATGGLLGAIIALPIIAFLRVIFITLVVPVVKKATGAESPGP